MFRKLVPTYLQNMFHQRERVRRIASLYK